MMPKIPSSNPMTRALLKGFGMWVIAAMTKQCNLGVPGQLCVEYCDKYVVEKIFECFTTHETIMWVLYLRIDL